MIGSSDLLQLSRIPEVNAARLGMATAIEAGDRTLNFVDLAREAAAVSDILARHGVGRGDRVAWLGRNCATFFSGLFGSTMLAACWVPINMRLAAGEIAFIVENGEAKVWIVDDGCLGLANQIVGNMANPPSILSTTQLLQDMAGGTADPAGERGSDPGDTILQLYTSGTTGLPKGVCITQAAYAAFLRLATRLSSFDYEVGETVIVAMPLFHVAGINVALSAIAQGCRMILISDFRPDDILATIAREKVAHIFLVPTMIQALLEAPSIDTVDLSSLRSVGYGAMPITQALLDAARKRLPCGFSQFYGMTETLGAGTYLSPSDHRPELLRSCGRAWEGLEVDVVDEEGVPLPVGTTGEIVIRGGTLMSGYWRNEDGTRKIFTRDGWLRTGDVGTRDAEGFFFINDRRNDLIISGGENIYPTEVENAIAGCPDILDVAVIGLPSERWGETVHACIVPRSGAQPTLAAVLAWARGRIGGYKLPRSIEIVESLPRSASGKVLRRELREAIATKVTSEPTAM